MGDGALIVIQHNIAEAGEYYKVFELKIEGLSMLGTSSTGDSGSSIWSEYEKLHQNKIGLKLKDYVGLKKR